MSIIPSASTNDTSAAPLEPALESKIYDSLVAFNSVACWDILRLAQMRQYLAEHLANDLAPELDRLCAQVAELEAQRDRRRGRLVALQNDALNMRGSLSPHGEARKVPFELGETLTPAVDWMIQRVAELEAQRATVLALHRKHSDSDHCFADDEAWPCQTRTAAAPAAPSRDLRPGADAARRMIRDRQDADTPRRRQLTPMQELAHDVETVIAPLTGDAKAGAEMVLSYIRTLAADATIPATEDAS